MEKQQQQQQQQIAPSILPEEHEIQKQAMVMAEKYAILHSKAVELLGENEKLKKLVEELQKKGTKTNKQ